MSTDREKRRAKKQVWYAQEPTCPDCMRILVSGLRYDAGKGWHGGGKCPECYRWDDEIVAGKPLPRFIYRAPVRRVL